MYLSLHCHHQNDSCTKMGSDESQFNNYFIDHEDKVARQYPQATPFEERREPKMTRTDVLLLLTSLTPYRLAKPAHEQRKNGSKSLKRRRSFLLFCFEG